MQAAYEAALAYAQNRTVFGSPIVDYELTRVKLGRMAMLTQAGRQFSYKVATMMAEGGGTSEAAMVKAYVCKAAEWVTREALQIHGGMGLMSDLPLERIWRDARIERIWEGTSEIQRHIISRAMLRPYGA